MIPRARTLGVEHGGEKLPALVFFYFVLGFIATYLLVQRVQKLLTCRRSRKCGAVIQRASKAPKIEKTFRSAIERNAHAIQQVDDAWRRLAHGFYRRLVSQKISTVNRVVEMLVGGIAFAFQILCRVNPALRAHGVRPLHRNDGEQIHVAACFGDLDDGGEPRKASTHHDDSRSCHLIDRILSRHSRQSAPARNSYDTVAVSCAISFTDCGIGGAKRSGAATRFHALIWLIATVRKTVSCWLKCVLSAS